MAERLYNVLTSLCTPALDIKLETLSAIVEGAMVMVQKLPEDLNKHVIELEQKLSSLEQRLDVMGNDLTELGNQEENSEPIVAPTPPVPLRQAIMAELRSLFTRRRGYNSPTDDKYKLRYCFGCKSTLSFGEICSRNPDKELEWLEKIWTHPSIEIYCCSCYDRFEKEEKERARIEESVKALKAEEREALNFIERRLDINIVITDQIRTITYRYRNLDNFARVFTMKGKHVTGLKLSLTGLTVLPPEIQLFSKLEILDLSDNLMVSIPEWISELPKLTVLDLSHNDLAQIPESILEKEGLQIYPLTARKRNPMVEIVRELKSKFGNEIPVRH